MPTNSSFLCVTVKRSEKWLLTGVTMAISGLLGGFGKGFPGIFGVVLAVESM